MSGLAGALTERIVIEARVDAADPLGGMSGLWTVADAAWAEIVADGHGAGVEAERRSGRRRWRLTLRRRPLNLADRLRWRGGPLAIRWIETDPRRPDRMIVHVEEMAE